MIPQFEKRKTKNGGLLQARVAWQGAASEGKAVEGKAEASFRTPRRFALAV
jgi:hypothetical protein